MAPPRLRLRISDCSVLLIYLPRQDERLSRPRWLTYSGRFTHISSHPAVGRAQNRESSLVFNDQRSTTAPCNQHLLTYVVFGKFLLQLRHSDIIFCQSWCQREGTLNTLEFAKLMKIKLTVEFGTKISWSVPKKSHKSIRAFKNASNKQRGLTFFGPPLWLRTCCHGIQSVRQFLRHRVSYCEHYFVCFVYMKATSVSIDWSWWRGLLDCVLNV